MQGVVKDLYQHNYTAAAAAVIIGQGLADELQDVRAIVNFKPKSRAHSSERHHLYRNHKRQSGFKKGRF